MMIHDFDIALWIMGSVPVRDSAAGSSIVDPEIAAAGDVSTAVVTLTFADGRLAVIKNSRRAVYGYEQRVELLGSKGLLSAGNVIENTVSKATADGVVSAKPEFFFLERYMRAYEAEWDAVALVAAELRNDPRLTDEHVGGECAVCQQPARPGDPLLPVLSPRRGRFTWLQGEDCWAEYQRRQVARVAAVMANAFPDLSIKTR
jgi:predicted dehydrogenase